MGLKDRLRGCAFRRQAPYHPSVGDAPQQSGVLVLTARHFLAQALALARPPVDGSQRATRTALFDEDEPSGIDPFGHHNPPGGTQEPVALAGLHAPFLRVCFMRSISRQSLDPLTENTATFCRYALLSESPAKGRSRISAASSFFARSSSFGCEPERLWCQEPYLPRHPDVALDRREAHPEKAGGLGFRHPPSDHRFDDLLPGVIGVRVHATMLLEGQPHCNTLLFTVVRGSRILGSTRSPDPPPQGILSPFGFDAPIVPGGRITAPRRHAPSDWGGAP